MRTDAIDSDYFGWANTAMTDIKKLKCTYIGRLSDDAEIRKCQSICADRTTEVLKLFREKFPEEFI